MKKLLIAVIGMLLLCGCSSEPTKAVAVLLKDETDSGLILFLDENNKTIKEMEVDYPSYLYFQGNNLYYSYDGENYSGVDAVKRSAVKGYDGIKYTVMQFFDNGDYVGYDSGGIIRFVEGDHEIGSLSVYPYCYLANGEYSCIVDTANRLYVYKHMQQLYTVNLYSPSYLGLTVIDGKSCVITDEGVTVIENEYLGTTYVFQKDFTIDSVNANRLYVEEGEETVCYKISMNSVGITLSEVLDQRFYTSVIFNEVFKDYYDKGYYAYNYYFVED